MRMKSIFVILLFFPTVFYGQLPLETVIQKGHELAVTTVAVSSDSNFVATGSKDKSVKLWTASGIEIRSFLGFESAVHTVVFAKDSKTLLAASNHSLSLWDIQTGRRKFNVTSLELLTRAVIDPKLLFFAYGGYADTVYIRKWETNEVVQTMLVNPDKGTGYGVSLAFSPDGQWFGIGETNRIYKIYKTSDWSLAYTLTYEQGWCGGCGTLMTFAADSRSVFVLSNGIPIREFSLHDGKLLREIADEVGDLSGITASSDGKWLARADEKNIKIWEASTGQLKKSIEAKPEANFHQIQFSPDNNQLLISSDDNTAFVFNISLDTVTTVFTGFLNQRDKGGLTYDPNSYWQSNIAQFIRLKNALLITPDGKTLIKGKFGTKVKQWDIASGQTHMEFAGHDKAVICYDLSKDGRYLLTGGGDGKVILWDVLTGDSLKVIKAHREPIFDIKFSSDETMFACSSWDASIRLYDLTQDKWIQYFDLDNNSAYNIMFMPNDLYLIISKLDKSLQMIEIDTKTTVRDFIGHTDIVSSLRLNAHQDQLLTAGRDGSIRLWDIGTGLMTKKFTGHEGAVDIAIFSKDERYIYSAGADRVIRVWDVNSKKVVNTLEGHNAEITSLLLNPDGTMLISNSLDGVTKFWNLKENKEFFEHIHFGERDWMVKTPEGYFNGTQDARKYIHFVSGLQTYGADQFFEDFYRPDLLPSIFNDRGVGKLDGIQDKLQKSPPPTVQIALLPNGDGKQTEVFVKITNNGGGAESLRLLQNGKSIPINKDNLKLPAKTGESTTYKQTFSLVSGENTFSAIATNKSRLESAPVEVSYFSDVITENPVCYILTIGINQYKNPRLNLNYAKPDAVSFISLLDDKSNGLFNKMKHIELYDHDASKVNILKTLDDLAAQVNADDVFIFYYAGHGSMVDNKFYFIPYESTRLYDDQALSQDAIEASILQEKFRHIKALKQVIIMDACQSGGSVELLAQRGASEEKAIAQLSRSAGIHIMASAGSEQYATEFTELGHGLFTYVLLKALQGAADGAPKDGKVTIYELKSYIDDQMPELTRKLKGKPQYPYTFSRGQDFPIILEVR